MLEVRNLCVTYGAIRAVQNLDLRVNKGEVVAIVGPNGAGKTSTMMAVSGLVHPCDGEIVFEGERIDRLPSHDIYGRGIVHVPEGRLIFGEMSVRDNLLIGADAAPKTAAEVVTLTEVLELFPVLKERLHHRADTLSGGQLQMLALARGMMGRPKLFMLDELSLGLAPKVVDEVFGIIARLKKRGMTVLLVEQNVEQALEIADQAYLLEAGRLVDAGPADQLRANEHIARCYLGVGATGHPTPNREISSRV